MLAGPFKLSPDSVKSAKTLLPHAKVDVFRPNALPSQGSDYTMCLVDRRSVTHARDTDEKRLGDYNGQEP